MKDLFNIYTIKSKIINIILLERIHIICSSFQSKEPVVLCLKRSTTFHNTTLFKDSRTDGLNQNL